jgi:hypothetical protein
MMMTRPPAFNFMLQRARAGATRATNVYAVCAAEVIPTH